MLSIMKKIRKLVSTIYKIDNLLELEKKTEYNIKKLNMKIEENSTLLTNLNNTFNSIEQEIMNLNINFKYTNLELLDLKRMDIYYKKRILILGFFGAPNLGDELMLEVMLSKLKKIKDIEITVLLCENEKYNIEKYENIKFLHYPKNQIDLNIISNYFDTLLVCGGALIDDSDYNYYNNQLSLGNIVINLSLRFIKCNKDVIIYGVSSSNCLRNEEYIKKLKYIIDKASFVCFRDTNSVNTLKKYNINIKKISIVNDIAIAYEKLKLNSSNHRSDKKNIGVIYICNEDTKSKLLSFTKKILKVAKEHNYSVTFIPFYMYLNNDVNYYKDIINNCDYDNIKISCNISNYEELIRELNKHDLIISMRYHATLISNLLNINVLNIVYDSHQHYKNKMNYMYDKYKFSKNIVEFSKIDNFEFKIDESLNGKCINFNKLVAQANEEIENMIDNFIVKEEK